MDYYDQNCFVIDTACPEKLKFFPQELPHEARLIWEQEHNEEQNTLNSTGFSRRQELIEKYGLLNCPLCISVQAAGGEEYVIDLGVWASQFCWVRSIEVSPIHTYDHNPARSYRIGGFENYPHLESLYMCFYRGEGEFHCSTDNLHGIEYCSNLKKLRIPGNQITDLTPISGLSIENLDVYSTPISSFRPINFECLKELIIDPSQLDLIREEYELSSLRILRVCSSSANFQEMKPALMNHPTITRLVEEYDFRIVSHGDMIFCGKRE